MDDQQRKLLEELLSTPEERVSFAKTLFFGGFHTASVLPFPWPTEEEKRTADELVDKLKAFAKQSIDAKAIDKASEIPNEVIKGLGDLGILGLTVPITYGGLGLSQYVYSRVMSSLACICGATALFVNAHQSIGLKALVLFGTEEQKCQWLPRLARGEIVAAFALTEPNAGSDASAVETRATHVPERGVYRIKGQKQWITNGSIASVLTVMAQTTVETPQGPRDKITAFLVTPDMPGFRIKDAALDKVGMRGSRTANLIFDDVEVPAKNILGPKGGGLKVCLTVLDYGRTTFGATCSGPAQLLLEKALYHANHRIQFKKPLAAFPLIKKKIATIAALAYAMESTTLLTAGLVDGGLEEFMLEAAILKVFNSESLWTILYETMQIFGGRSFFTDEPLERMMRDARLNMIGEGANEVLRAFIAAVGMRDVGLHLQGMKEALRHPWRNRKILYSLTRYLHKPRIPLKSPLLAAESALLAQTIKDFGRVIPKLLSRYREKIIDQELILDRVASIVIALYTSTAVLSRIDSDIAAHRHQANDLAAAHFYCQTALNSAQATLRNIFDPTDRAIESLSDELTGVSVT